MTRNLRRFGLRFHAGMRRIDVGWPCAGRRHCRWIAAALVRMTTGLTKWRNVLVLPEGGTNQDGGAGGAPVPVG
jgi:hypothetical protein